MRAYVCVRACACVCVGVYVCVRACAYECVGVHVCVRAQIAAVKRSATTDRVVEEVKASGRAVADTLVDSPGGALPVSPSPLVNVRRVWACQRASAARGRVGPLCGGQEGGGRGGGQASREG